MKMHDKVLAQDLDGIFQFYRKVKEIDRSHFAGQLVDLC